MRPLPWVGCGGCMRHRTETKRRGQVDRKLILGFTISTASRPIRDDSSKEAVARSEVRNLPVLRYAPPGKIEARLARAYLATVPTLAEDWLGLSASAPWPPPWPLRPTPTDCKETHPGVVHLCRRGRGLQRESRRGSWSRLHPLGRR